MHNKNSLNASSCITIIGTCYCLLCQIYVVAGNDLNIIIDNYFHIL